MGSILLVTKVDVCLSVFGAVDTAYRTYGSSVSTAFIRLVAEVTPEALYLTAFGPLCKIDLSQVMPEALYLTAVGPLLKSYPKQ